MIIVGILQLILYLILIPFSIGMFFSRGLSKEYKTFGRVYVFGFMTVLAETEIIFLAAYFLKQRFSTFVIILSVVLFVSSVVSVILNRKKFKEIHFIKTDYSFLVLCAITLFAVIMRNLQGINDGDDAYVLGVALTTLTNGHFYTIDYYTGTAMASDNYLRHLMAADPMFIAFISKVSFIHPTVVAHRVLGSLYIPIRSIIMYDIGELLLDKEENKKFRSMFASLVLYISIWNFHSFETDSTFFLTRTWQGKAMFCGLLIPLTIEIMLLIGKEEKVNHYFALLAILCASAVFMTPVALYMFPMLVGVSGLCVGIAKKKFGVFFKTCVSLIPMVLFFVIYWRFCR